MSVDHRAEAERELRYAADASIDDGSAGYHLAAAQVHATLAAAEPDTDALRRARREADGEREVRREVARIANELRAAVRLHLAASHSETLHSPTDRQNALDQLRDLVGGPS